MNDNYYLKIGRNEVLGDENVANLDSDDPSIKKKAEISISKRLKETRVRVGTLLKTDNVSFLIGAGASMLAGGGVLHRYLCRWKDNFMSTRSRRNKPMTGCRYFI